MNLYYLTRTFPPQHTGGGALMREATVNLLRKIGWRVIVVTPNYVSDKIEQDENIIRIPYKFSQSIGYLFERVGLFEDYLDPWVKKSFTLLQNIITKDDIVFATTGSDLATIKLGSYLKYKTNCKFVINYRDPVQAVKYGDIYFNKNFHINRNSEEKKYTKNADLIITSSKSFYNQLKEKYPELKNKIHNNYFGYLKEDSIPSPAKVNIKNKLRVVYAGNMGNLQKPEILAKSVQYAKNKDNIEIIYIGDFEKYGKLSKFPNVKLMKYMERSKLTNFLLNNTDVGFVSLAKEFLRFCFPSKIYEYINLQLPILGALPYGDAFEIINKNGFGISRHYSDLNGIANAMDKLFIPDNLENFRKNIAKNREQWAMEEKIKEVDKLLRKMI